jgi:dUTP pyrophosphatase
MSSVNLIIYINPEFKELVELYEKYADEHNKHIALDEFPNSGFDVFIPDNVTFNDVANNKMVNLQIKTEMIEIVNNNFTNPQAFYVYPRSSMSKTPLILSNHVGIIDSGYRGWLHGAFKYFPSSNSETFTIEKHTRLLQICHPTLRPFNVTIVHDENVLSKTNRGSGGFGSTGLVGV